MRLLDLFCGAGGCAVGYHRAGFAEIIGIDHRTQLRYPFDFVRADAMEYLAEHGMEFDAIHASPPCQAYSAANNIHGRKDHPRLIEPLRELLLSVGVPYVIENVVGAPMRFPAEVCGLALGLRVKRHRWFESSALLFGTGCGDHSSDYVVVFGGGAKGRGKTIGLTAKGGPMIRRRFVAHEVAKRAMGIDWMNRDELSQAIPPPYTEFIGRQLLAALQEVPAGGAESEAKQKNLFEIEAGATLEGRGDA